MSDGCWVQFWDHDGFQTLATEGNPNPPENPTLRIDAKDGSISVNNLDAYKQSDGDKAGDEPDSLKTGSRSWLVVYKDKDFKGRSASFGPNSEIKDLDAYGMGGNISSFKLFDYRPPSFVDSSHQSTTTALETDGGPVSAQTVNNVFRNTVAASLNFIPVVGGALGTVIGGLWPDVNNRDQVWGSYQNYLNQAIAGVYWQITYESLNDTLESLYKSAKRYVDTPDEEHAFKADNFRALYDLVNNTESYFINEEVPEKRYMFLAPYASLRLATLREHLEHFDFYYGKEPSEETRGQLAAEIRRSIDLYRKLLGDARDRILHGRRQKIITTRLGPSTALYLVDQYNGHTEHIEEKEREERTCQYADRVINQLALTLDTHNAIGQLWEYFDPKVPGPVRSPTLSYATGPYGWYQKVEPFSQVATGGRITELAMWTGTVVDALELSIDGVAQGRVGAKGDGGRSSLILADGERIVSVNGYQTGLINALRFTTSQGRVLEGGRDEGIDVRRFEVHPMEGSLDTRLVGLTGQAGVGSGGDLNIKAITFCWSCELPIAPAEKQAPAVIAS
ncbi:jacalin-like lectin [Archangium gephyra]|uniref:jacalin-like lectin n=1 Tax=Archangium gephyra TaxID=48 RepID=UPI003B7CD4AD